MTSPITLRQQMVAGMRGKNGAIRSPEVEQAFLHVPRHKFVPDVDHETAYKDAVVVVKVDDSGYPISSSSQPTMMALMLEQMRLKPGMRVMEIGAGSGYNAALMAHIVGANGRVVTIDIDEDLVAGARAHLSNAGYHSNVEVVCTDGVHGHPPTAPYDRIILTAAGWDISPQWHHQLAPDGMIIMPFVIQQEQFSVALQKRGNTYTSKSMLRCRFMPMRGEQPGLSDAYTITVRPQVEFRINLNDPSTVPDEAKIRQWLTSPVQDIKSGLKFTGDEVNNWVLVDLLADAKNLNLCGLVAFGDEVMAKDVPYLGGSRRYYRHTRGLVAKDGMVLLMRPARMKLPQDEERRKRFPLWMRVYGTGGMRLARAYRALLERWDTIGRPDYHKLWMRVVPIDAVVPPQPDTVVIQKRWTQLIIGWR